MGEYKLLENAKKLSTKLNESINTLVSNVSKDEAKQKLVTTLYDSSFNTLSNIQKYINNYIYKPIQNNNYNVINFFTGNTQKTQIKGDQINGYEDIKNPLENNLYKTDNIGSLPQIIYALQNNK